MMKRWLAGALGLVLTLGTTAGCNRQCFLSKEVFEQANAAGLAPPSLEEPGAGQHVPLTGDAPEPAIVSQSDRPPRPLSLQEAIAIALENGVVSGRTGVGTGRVGSGGDFDLTLVSGAQPFLQNQTDFIRVLALNPA